MLVSMVSAPLRDHLVGRTPSDNRSHTFRSNYLRQRRGSSSVLSSSMTETGRNLSFQSEDESLKSSNSQFTSLVRSVDRFNYRIPPLLRSATNPMNQVKHTRRHESGNATPFSRRRKENNTIQNDGNTIIRQQQEKQEQHMVMSSGNEEIWLPHKLASNRKGIPSLVGGENNPRLRNFRRCPYWQEFPTPTGVTDDDEEEENPSEDTDESSSLVCRNCHLHRQQPRFPQTDSVPSISGLPFQYPKRALSKRTMKIDVAGPALLKTRTSSEIADEAYSWSSSSRCASSSDPLVYYPNAALSLEGDSITMLDPGSLSESSSQPVSSSSYYGYDKTNPSSLCSSTPSSPSSIMASPLGYSHHRIYHYRLKSEKSNGQALATLSTPPYQTSQCNRVPSSSVHSERYPSQSVVSDNISTPLNPHKSNYIPYAMLTQSVPAPSGVTPSCYQNGQSVRHISLTKNSGLTNHSESTNKANQSINCSTQLTDKPPSSSNFSFQNKRPLLGGRRLRLLTYHGFFLLWFAISILLGMILHQSKIYRIKMSLSIEGFEAFLPSPVTSLSTRSSYPRRINLGALLAADLLRLGWGRGTTQFGFMSQDVEVKSETQVVPFHCTELIESPKSHLDSESTCPLYEDIIDTTLCSQEMLSKATDAIEHYRTMWDSTPTSCSAFFDYSRLANLDSSIMNDFRQFAPLLLTWRQVTPLLLPSCPSQSVTRTSLPSTNATMAALQRDVYRLATRHPKLKSLYDIFSTEHRGRVQNNYDTGTCDRATEVETSAQSNFSNRKYEKAILMDDASQILRLFGLLKDLDVQLFSIRTSTPAGLLDSSIWFSRSTPSSWSFKRSKKFNLVTSLEQTSMEGPAAGYDSETSKFEESTPMRLLNQLSVHWKVEREFFGSIGRPVISVSEHQHTGKESDTGNQALILQPHWTEESFDNEKFALWLFMLSRGIISPSYPGHLFIKWLLTSAVVYLALFVSWLHSFASPNPITLVHFPRLVFDQIIIIYRGIMLYLIGGFLETLTGLDLDFSDHVVLYMMIGMILCIECTAAERSHPRNAVLKKKRGNLRSWLLLNKRSNNESDRDQILSDGNVMEQRLDMNDEVKSDTVTNYSSRFIGVLETWFNSDSEDVEAENIRPPTVPFMVNDNSTIVTSCTIDEMKELQKDDITWEWPYPVKFVHWCTYLFFSLLWYSAFFTALFFHHPHEIILGFLVGFVGLYVPFWILLSGGCLSLDRFGILRGRFKQPSQG